MRLSVCLQTELLLWGQNMQTFSTIYKLLETAKKEIKSKLDLKVGMHVEVTADNTSGNVFLCESI